MANKPSKVVIREAWHALEVLATHRLMTTLKYVPRRSDGDLIKKIKSGFKISNDAIDKAARKYALVLHEVHRLYQFRNDRMNVASQQDFRTLTDGSELALGKHFEVLEKLGIPIKTSPLFRFRHEEITLPRASQKAKEIKRKRPRVLLRK